MPRMAQFILVLIVGLALLTWAASGVVQTTAREWFERDAASRAQLALVSARQSLSGSWYGKPVDFDSQLADLTHDEGVMGVEACNGDLTIRSRTPGFPDEFGCWIVGSRMRLAS